MTLTFYLYINVSMYEIQNGAFKTSDDVCIPVVYDLCTTACGNCGGANFSESAFVVGNYGNYMGLPFSGSLRCD